MKPRTKLQREIVKMSGWLESDVDKKVLEYAYSKINTRFGFSTGKTYWCGVCGDVHSAKEIENKSVKCRSCNSDLYILETRKRKFHETYYIAYAEPMFEYQVIRMFLINTYYSKGNQWKSSISECVQQFHLDHEMYIIGRLAGYGMQPMYGEMEFRKPTYWKMDSYNQWPAAYHPDSKFLPEFEKKGCKGDIGNVQFEGLKKVLSFNCTQSETLLKIRQSEYLKLAIKDIYKVQSYWPSIKIAIRNNYVPYDIGIWTDYLDLLRFFNKDLRNPHYICPADLKHEHDKFVKKKREHDKEMDRINQLKRLEEDSRLYEFSKSHFFGLTFTRGKLSLNVLSSVQEFIEEANAMDHCVYTNKYYNRLNSLILSAKYDGHRVETVELSLKDFTILQSRGKNNVATKYNKAIRNLLMDNIETIAELHYNHSSNKHLQAS